MLVDHQCQALPLAGAEYRGRANLVRTVPDEPYVQVPAASLGAIDSKLDIDDPVDIRYRTVGPDSTSLVARSGGCEDELVGEKLRYLGVTLDREIRDGLASFWAYPARG